MKALVIDASTDRLTVVERPQPEPGESQVLVRVEAVALNNADLNTGPDTIVGFEFAGTVDAVGAGVDAELVGTRVMGITGQAFAEYAVAHHRHLMPIPDELSAAEAAPMPTALSTEDGAQRTAGLAQGHSVLVTAATSGIALVGLQLAALRGASRIIATTRDASRRELLHSVGATDVIVTDGDDLADRVLALTDAEGVDIAFDHVAGGMLAAAIDATRVGGTVISVGRLASSSAEIDLFRLARRQVTLRSVSYGLTPPERIGDLLDDVAANYADRLADGSLRAVVDATYSLDDAGDALDRLRSSDTVGKVVISFA